MLVTALGSEMEAQDGKIIDCFVLLIFSLPYLPRSGQPRDQASYYTDITVHEQGRRGQVSLWSLT